MYRMNKGAHIVWINRGMNTVAEVENMTRTLSVTGQYITHLFTDAIWVGVEYAGIHVAL